MRRKTRTIKIGNLRLGSGYPVRIQSMAKTDTRDVAATTREIKRLEDAGCEIVRVAVKDLESARAIGRIKKKIKIPLVADIHFDYKLALEAIRQGADKIRINPGNISKPDQLKEIISAARSRKIPIRIGINSGSVPRGADPVSLAKRYIKVFEAQRFYDIIISIKSSDVAETVKLNRELAKSCGYPIHLGVTAAGPFRSSIVKSSIAIGGLLLDGIGDTIRVSMTGSPVDEVRVARDILSALRIRSFGPEIISCPTCGRCQVDLVGIVLDLDSRLRRTRDGGPRTTRFARVRGKRRTKPLSLAVMGCEVNGPGEARSADAGVAFGKGTCVLFRKGKIIKRVKAKDAAKELLRQL